MRFYVLALACWLAASIFPANAQPASALAPLTLAEAMRLAETANPAVRAREAQLASAEGLRREASSLLFNNPVVGVNRARRRIDGIGGPSSEAGVFITQPFETGGQQGLRREAAAAALDAVRAEIEAARREARAEAAIRFHAVLAAQRRVQLEQHSLELFESSAQAVEKRRAAGEDTRLDANVALIEAERARNALASASEQLIDARGELGRVLQLPPSLMPELAGELVEPADGAYNYPLDRLLAAAMSLPAQRALAARENTARARVGVERANRYPDVTVGLSVGREGDSGARQTLTTFSVSLPLPLFKRNDAAIGQALSDASQAEIDRSAAMRDTQARVRQLWSRLQSQRERVRRLQGTMVSASSANQQLAARSRQVGQIGLLDQLLVNRQALEAQRELIDALAQFHTTRIELEQAAGWSPEGSAP